jgi:hypothetical protein
VSVLLGNGDGTFQAARNFAAGNRPWSVAVGDFNGDGIPDLAVANSYSNNVSVLLGNGDGTFQAARNFAAGSFPLSVAVGDLNGDGTLDLAVANSGGNNVSVLLGNGDGTFQAARNYAVGNGPLSVAVGDFNGDGAPDLAVANFFSNDVSILLNDNTWPPGPRRPGSGRSPQMTPAAAPDRFVAAALFPMVSAPAVLPTLPETPARPSQAPMLSASDEVRPESPVLQASPALHVPPQGTAARLLDRLFAHPEGTGLWDRSADLEESGSILNMVATT